MKQKIADFILRSRIVHWAVRNQSACSDQNISFVVEGGHDIENYLIKKLDIMTEDDS